MDKTRGCQHHPATGQDLLPYFRVSRKVMVIVKEIGEVRFCKVFAALIGSAYQIRVCPVPWRNKPIFIPQSEVSKDSRVVQGGVYSENLQVFRCWYSQKVSAPAAPVIFIECVAGSYAYFSECNNKSTNAKEACQRSSSYYTPVVVHKGEQIAQVLYVYLGQSLLHYSSRSETGQVEESLRLPCLLHSAEKEV